MARRLGEAFVGLQADASLFRASAIAGMKKALAGVTGNITLKADMDARQANAAVAALKLRMEALSKTLANLRADANTKPAEAKIVGLQVKMFGLLKQLQNIPMDVDSREIDRKIAGLKAEVSLFQRAIGNMKVGADTSVFDRQVAELKAKIAVLEQQKIELPVHIDEGKFLAIERDLLGLEAAAQAAGGDGGIGGLNRSLGRGGFYFGRFGLGLIGLRVSLFAGLRTISAMHLALDVLFESLAAGVPAVAVLVGGLAAFFGAAALGQDTLGRMADHLKAVNTVATATGQTIPPLTDAFDKLASKIRPDVFQLYGAALTLAGQSQGTFNDLAVKTGSVLDRMAARIVVDMQTSGTGINAFIAAGSRDLAIFGQIFVNLGHVIANIAKVANQTHIAEFLLEGVRAATQLLNVISSLPTGLLVTLALLHSFYLYGGLATTALVRLLNPLANIAAAAGGVAVTERAVSNLGKDASGLDKVKAALTDIGNGAAGLQGNAAKGLAAFKGGLVAIASSPWTWVGVAVAAFGTYVYFTLHAKDATDQFITSIHQLEGSATVLSGFNTTGAALIQTNLQIAATQAKVNQELAAFHGDATAAAQASAAISGQGVAYATTLEDLQKLMALKSQESNQLVHEVAAVGAVAQAYGVDLTGALALAATAGVKWQDLTSTNVKTQAIALAQIASLVKGYANMGQGIGQLGSDMNALTVAGSDQLKAIQNLNSAYDTFTKTVSGPVDTFITLANSFDRFSNDASVAGAQMTGLGEGFVAVSKKVTTPALQLQSDFQASFSAAQQLFDAMRSSQAPVDQQVSAIKLAVQSLIPLAGTNKVAAAEISALAQEAGGPATTSLQSLSDWAGKSRDPIGQLQQVSDNAAIGFSNLSLDAQKLATTLQQDLTSAEALAVENAVGLQGALNAVALDIKNGTTATQQGQADRQKLNEDLAAMGLKGQTAADVINALNSQIHANTSADDAGRAARAQVRKDIQDITREIQNNTLTSDAGKASRAKLAADFQNAGASATQARQNVNNLTTALELLPKNTNLKVSMSGDGQFQITSAVDGKTYSISPGGYLSPHAMGGYISGGMPGKDSVPALLMPGEVVVPTKMVRAGAVDHLRGMLPGFATGGQVPRFAAGGQVLWGLTPSFTNSIYSRGTGQDVSDMERILRAASVNAERTNKVVQAYNTQQSAQGQVLARASHTAGSVIQWITQAMQLTGAPASWLPDLEVIALYESGDNPNSINLTDSNAAAGDPSRGLFQTIGATFSAYHQPGTSWNIYDPVANAAAAINYIRARYGSVFNVPGIVSISHGGPYVGYAAGGLVKGYSTGGGVQVPGYTPLINAVRAEMGNFWKLQGDVLPKSASTGARSSFKAWLNALQAQQLATIGLGRNPPGAFDVLNTALTSDFPGDTPPKDWLAFQKQLGLLTAYQAGIGIPGGINPPGTPRDSGYPAWKLEHADWQNLRNSLLRLQDVAQMAFLDWQPVTHTYGGDVVVDTIGQALAAQLPTVGAAKGMYVGSYDRGGHLPPGLSMAWNGTGSPEPVGAAPVQVTIEIGGTGNPSFDALMLTWLRKTVMVRGGGNVQRALGGH